MSALTGKYIRDTPSSSSGKQGKTRQISRESSDQASTNKKSTKTDPILLAY